MCRKQDSSLTKSSCLLRSPHHEVYGVMFGVAAGMLASVALQYASMRAGTQVVIAVHIIENVFGASIYTVTAAELMVVLTNSCMATMLSIYVYYRVSHGMPIFTTASCICLVFGVQVALIVWYSMSSIQFELASLIQVFFTQICSGFMVSQIVLNQFGKPKGSGCVGKICGEVANGGKSKGPGLFDIERGVE